MRPKSAFDRKAQLRFGRRYGWQYRWYKRTRLFSENLRPAGTEDEVRDIYETLGSKEVYRKLLLGAESTEGNFKNFKDFNIIHIATHGFFIDKDHGVGEYLDPMLYSGLLLSGASDETTMANTGEDGV